MAFLALVDAPLSSESMKFPVFFLLAGNLGIFRDEFAADSPLQQGVWCEPGFQHDRSAIAEAASQFQKGLDQLARTSGSTSKSTNLE